MFRVAILRSLIAYAFVLISFGFLHGQLAGSGPFKATDAGTPFDLQGFLDGEIKAGNKHIVIPPGRYRVTPKDRAHLTFSNLKNVDIVADGVEMVCTKTTVAIHMTDCSDVHIKGLTVDYDPLPFSEGKIVAMAEDKSWLEFELIDGYPEDKLEMRIEIYDPATGELRRSDPPFTDTVEKVGDKRYRATTWPGYSLNPGIDTQEVGDIVVCGNNNTPDLYWSDGIVMDKCQNITWENTWLYASNSNGMVEHGCDNIHYQNCHFDRRPLDSDYPPRGFARMRSLNAGGIHCFDDTKGPTILNCVFEFGGDDGVNLHGTYFMVTSCDGPVLRVLATVPVNIAPGDMVDFVPADGSLQPSAKATNVQVESSTTTDDDRSLVAKMPLTDWGRSMLSKFGRPVYDVTLDHPVNVPPGTLICADNRMGNGFVIKDSVFSHNRSRGLLIKAGDGQIIGNKMVGNWLDAVLIAPEFFWLESGLSNNIVLQNNTIDSCHATAIDVNALSGNCQVLSSGAHSNIKILDNTVTRSRWPNIAVTSTVGLQVTGNTLVSAKDAVGLPPTISFETNVPYGSMFMRGVTAAHNPNPVDYASSAILNLNCDAPIIKDNKE